MNITDFFDKDNDDIKDSFFINKRCLYNGTVDIWDEMPYFETDTKSKFLYDLIEIEFDSIEEAKEFNNIFKFSINWDDRAWFGIGKWYPPKDSKRNSLFRVMHIETALANPELYEIVSFDEIKP